MHLTIFRFQSLVYLVVLILIVVTTSRRSPCKNSENLPCRCETVQNFNGLLEDHVNCSREGLSEIPDTLPDFITVLDVSRNRLLPEKLHKLCKYKNLAEVSLAYNYLNELPNDKLIDCNISHRLNLEGNVFNYISSRSLHGLEDVEVISGLEAQKFDQDTFTEFGRLKSLTMKTYQMTISSDIFASLRLRHLSLSVSGALQLPADLVRFGTTSLTELYLESTSLQRIPNNFVNHLLKIVSLTLKMNDIHALPVDLFQFEEQNNLHSIHISGVRSLPRGIFDGLDHLTRLEIHDMEDFPSNLFEGLMELVHLDLTNSFFGYGNVPPYLFADLWSLKNLNLSDCSITELEENSFEGLHALESLNVSFNSIRYLTGRPFIHVQSSLRELVLKANDISVIEATVLKELAKLQTLDLSDNNIYSLNENAFTDLLKLERLMLNRNKMAHLPSGLFRGLTALQSLNLAYNVLDDDPGSLLSDAKDLSVLNLSDNRITTLSLPLVNKLVGLTDLNMEYNPLICDCELLTMRDLLMSRNVYLTATCSSPTYGSLENVIISDCQETTYHTTESESQSSVDYASGTSSTASMDETNTASDFNVTTPAEITDSPITSTTDTAIVDSADFATAVNVQVETTDTRVTSASGTSIIETADIATAVNIPLETTDSPITSTTHTAVVDATETGIVDTTVKDVADSSATSFTVLSTLPISTIIHPKIHVNPQLESEASVVPEMSRETKYYISVATISSVSFFCVVILICLACRKRRSRLYQISEVFARDIEFDKVFSGLGDDSPRCETRRGSRNSTLATLKEVPSVQIDVVDDDGNIDSVMYPAAEVPILMSK